jgi:hypothetical protein
MPKWEDIREDLFEAVMQVHPAMNKEQQADVVRLMRSKGHDMGWNAIRYVFLLFSGRTSSFQLSSEQVRRLDGMFVSVFLPFLKYFPLVSSQNLPAYFTSTLLLRFFTTHNYSTFLLHLPAHCKESKTTQTSCRELCKIGTPRRTRLCSWP